MFPSPYLYQTSNWEKFWLSSHDQNHQCYELHVIEADRILRGNVFEYPWHFNQKIMHIPAGPYIEHGNYSTSQIKSAVAEFLNKVGQIAQQNQILATKWDLDYNLASILGIKDRNDMMSFVSEISSNNIGIPVISNNSLMFSDVAIIDTSLLKLPTNSNFEVSNNALAEFLELNQSFWHNRSETTRKQTRNSLHKEWSLDTEINSYSVSEAYQILKTTADRQSFNLPSENYFQTLMEKDFAHLLILRDQDYQPHGVWIGIHSENSLTNLYGGNTEYSLKNFGPNLMHLYGLYKALWLNCQWYDLGGFDTKSGSGRFKKGYRPEIINFAGTIDLVYLPWYYRILEFGAKGKKILQR